MAPIVRVRLSCQLFYVDVRLAEINGRYLASADTRDGPTLGTGQGAIEALTAALEPFSGMREQLLDSLPRSME